MAAIGRLPETLADRSIVIRMHRKRGVDNCERLRNLDPGALARCCARFVHDHARAIVSAHPDIPDQLNDRAADIWEPLLALADIAGGDWPKKSREAAIRLTATAHESNPVGALILDIFLAFTEKNVERLFSRDIVQWLNCLGDRPWSDNQRGKPIDELWLARRLRPYGIRPKTLWINADHAKGYVKDDFQQAGSRYVTRADLDELRADIGTAPDDEAPAASTSAVDKSASEPRHATGPKAAAA